VPAADAAVVETPVTAADGDTTIAGVVYFDSLSGEREILEVSVVTVGSGTSLARTSRAELGSITALLRAREQETQPSRHSEDIKRSGKQHHFHPHRFFGLWSNGPFDGGLPGGCLRTDKAVGKFKRTQQPDMKYTWNTMAASSFWDVRLSVACTATDAEFQNRIIIRDHTMNSPLWRGSSTPTLTMRRTRRRARP
jgi:hypothetical protein